MKNIEYSIIISDLVEYNKFKLTDIVSCWRRWVHQKNKKLLLQNIITLRLTLLPEVQHEWKFSHNTVLWRCVFQGILTSKFWVEMCRVSFSLTLYPDKGIFVYPCPTLPCRSSTLPCKISTILYPYPTLPCKIFRFVYLTLHCKFYSIIPLWLAILIFPHSVEPTSHPCTIGNYYFTIYSCYSSTIIEKKY